MPNDRSIEYAHEQASDQLNDLRDADLQDLHDCISDVLGLCLRYPGFVILTHKV